MVMLAAMLAASGFFPGRAMPADVASPHCVELAGINLLANPGADEGPFPSTSLPAGWTHQTWREEGVSFAWDDTVSRRGRKSVRITADSANDASWLQKVPVEPHTRYVLSGWIRTDGVTHTGDLVDAGANLSLHGTWMRTDGVFGTQDWTYVSLAFETGPEVEVTVAARLGFWAGSSAGTAWFDDLRLLAADEGALVNGGFERGLFVVNGPAPAWSPSAERCGRAALAWDDSVRADGDKSLRIGLATPGTAAWSQRVVVRPHGRYRLSGRIRTKGVHAVGPEWTRGGAHLAVPEAHAASSARSGTRSFARVELEFDAGDHEVVTIEARLGSPRHGASGVAWFDALQLVPLDPPQSPGWRILGLVYGRTEFEFTDGSGVRRHLLAAMSGTERDRAVSSLRRFFRAEVPALTSGNMIPSLTICYPETPLAGLEPFGGGFWPSPLTTARDLLPGFDSAVVIWDPSGVDRDTGQPITVANASGLTAWRGTQQTYASVIVDALSDRHRNVLKHEWGHSILYYHDAAGTAPKPAVDNHAGRDYVHCPSGERYVLVDETDDERIPWSTYDNELGFTRDYYSGRTALAGDPTRCLGVTDEAWAAGGPSRR
jgi:hypothetical protein